MSQAFSQSNILSGFEKAGIHPFNPEIFTDDDFLCCVTDRELSQEQASTSAPVSLESQLVFSTRFQESSHLEQNNITNPTVSLQESENDHNIGGYGHGSDLEQHQECADEPGNVILSTSTDAKFIRASSEPLKINRFQVAISPLPEHFMGKRPSSAPPHGYLSQEPSNAESPIRNKSAIDLQCSSLAPMGSRDQAILNRCTNSSPIPSSSNVEIVTPEMVRPFPKAPPRKMARRGRQPGKTKILTMTPEKKNNNECLSETLNNIFDDSKRPKRKLKETQSNVTKNDEIKKRKMNIKKRIFENSDTESQNENDTNKTTKKVQEDTNKKGKKIIKTKQNPKLKDDKKENVPGKTKGKKTLKTKQGSKQKAQRKKTGKGKKNKNVNDDSETECEDEDVAYADSSSNSDFAENPDVNDRWYCFICQSEEIMTMRLCRLCRRYVHEICVGLTQDIDDFICHECDQN